MNFRICGRFPSIKHRPLLWAGLLRPPFSTVLFGGSVWGSWQCGGCGWSTDSAINQCCDDDAKQRQFSGGMVHGRKDGIRKSWNSNEEDRTSWMVLNFWWGSMSIGLFAMGFTHVNESSISYAKSNSAIKSSFGVRLTKETFNWIKRHSSI